MHFMIKIGTEKKDEITSKPSTFLEKIVYEVRITKLNQSCGTGIVSHAGTLHTLSRATGSMHGS